MKCRIESDGHCYCEVVKPHRHDYWKNVCVYYKQHSAVWLHSEGGRDSRLTANTGPFNMVSTVHGCRMLCLVHHTKLYRGDMHTPSPVTYPPVVTFPPTPPPVTCPPVVTCPPTPECTCPPTPPPVTCPPAVTCPSVVECPSVPCPTLLPATPPGKVATCENVAWYINTFWRCVCASGVI